MQRPAGDVIVTYRHMYTVSVAEDIEFSTVISDKETPVSAIRRSRPSARRNAAIFRFTEKRG